MVGKQGGIREEDRNNYIGKRHYTHAKDKEEKLNVAHATYYTYVINYEYN